ncbi:beta-N-acetylhexosaminidase [Roseivivax halotolerans]|uniref:beta-N-acetylhexosaminidase n=1 Tax=Roseivivax halotolerans TaxID=93684 RepID=A0A1I5ZDG6_9RHOB|nr:glycoside hydrolase family 3 N-terminal domain-containing protein [Roseivivax halotolerans]SFQ54500.1 beta-N-acetylhexosaminidase [Roseivivax halotolerans]
MSRFGAAILAPGGTTLGASERRLFAETNPFGFILFSRNLENPDQISALTADLRDAVGRDAPIFIDQEGGRVQRLRPPLARSWDAPLEFAARYGDNAAQAFYLRYRIIAAELRSYGIDGNCAPTLDIARDETHSVLHHRCLGTSVRAVTERGRAAAQAHFDGGVLPVMKHMPGHGLAKLDSHLALPRIDAAPDDLMQADFAVFRAFADLPLGMTAHLVFEAFDRQPATISNRMIALIRQELGFRGFLMTDDISMEALSGTVPERGAAAIAAGCDCVLHCNGEMDEMAPLMERVGKMSAESHVRAVAALTARRDPGEVDIAELSAKLDALPSERAG